MTTTDKPKFAIRITTLFGWFIPIYIIFSYFNYREGINFNLYICLLFCALAIGIALPDCIRILKITRKKESKLVTVVVSLLALAAVIK